MSPYLLDRKRSPSETGAKQQEPDLEHNTPQEAEGSKRVVPWEEIQKHDKPHDCWVVYEGLVYDVTEFISEHPGDAALWRQGAGRDITNLFNKGHPPSVAIESYGKIVGEAEGPRFRRDRRCRRLGGDWQQ
jgi:cytochrome b involved in lipid metabolism